ncbi:MAG: DUF3341 domain-containing protein [Bryobacteraceae bacterium]
MTKKPIYGLMAEFESPAALVEAARKTTQAGYRNFDAYSPYPIEELHEAMEHRRGYLPLIVLIGGIVGGLSGYLLQYWVSVINYPLNIGGRPLHSMPAFIPVTFEMTILAAGIAAVLGMLAVNGLPMPYHPVFNVPRFALASRSRFFLCIESADPRFEHHETARFLESLAPREVSEVAH